MRLMSAVNYDIRLQFRHGFYYAYLIVCVIYIIILRIIPLNIKQTAAVLVIFTDPSALGFFFLGGIILFEKGQKTLEGLFITPIRIYEYIFSKVISLTVLALASSLLIALCAVGFTFNVLVFSIGVVLSSILFILLGFTLVCFSKSVNHYLIFSPLYMILFMAPVVDYLGFFKQPFFYIFPSTASLLLLDTSFTGITFPRFVYAVILLCAWIYATYKWAYHWFYKYIVLSTGEVK